MAKYALKTVNFDTQRYQLVGAHASCGAYRRTDTGAILRQFTCAIEGLHDAVRARLSPAPWFPFSTARYREKQQNMP